VSPQTGPLGYYVPVAGSLDFNVHTYANNTLGVVQNPTGGCNFIGATGPGAGVFARAQLDITYPTPLVTVGYDICARFTGTLPAAQNLGSFSLQPFPGSKSFIALATWTDPATAATWNADYVHFDSTGLQVQSQVASAGFTGLLTNHWYRWETDLNLTTNEITQIRLTDLTSGTTVTDNPVGWFMEGGSASASVNPTGLRFFSGGGNPGNVLCFDNACVDVQGTCATPAPTTPEYQINQAAASLNVDASALGAFCAPGAVTITAGVPAMASFDGTATGGAWELGVSFMPLLSVTSGAPVLADGQIININLADPGLVLLWNGFLSPPFTPLTAPFTLPVSTINAQMAIVNPATPSGLSMSQPIEITAQ
jgi:hypothetical protein